jgi:lysophospholipase L1-like esterase
MKNTVINLVLNCWLALALTACSSSTQLPAIPEDGVIMAFGDSLTYGTGVSNGSSYPAILQKLSGRKVINAGVPGEISEDGKSRLEDLLDQHTPDLLILCHGGNDILRKIKNDKTIRNLQAMINMANERNIPVILIGVPKPALLMDAADFYVTIAEINNIPIEEDVLADILSKPSLKSDTIHPNGKGYEQLAEAVYDLLTESGAL